MDLLLGRLRTPVVEDDAQPGAHTHQPEPARAEPAPAQAEPAPVFHPATPEDHADNFEWTFRPDDAHDLTPPVAVAETELVDDEAQPPRHRARIAPRLGVIVIVGALVTGVLALTHIGPFRPSPGAAATLSTPADMPTNLLGVWSVQDSYGNVPFPATMHITTENRSSGTFVGSITSPVGVETITGKVIATAVSFTINLGSGTERGSGVVSKTGGKVQIQATFSNSSGGHGTIAATRTSP